MIDVQEPQDVHARFGLTMILDCLDENIRLEIFAETRGQLDDAVYIVVGSHVSADETNYDDRPRRGRAGVRTEARSVRLAR